MRRASIKHQLLTILLVSTTLLAHQSNAQTCTFCENGITNPSLPLSEGGDQTCADAPFLIAGELDGSIACTTIKESELLCCPTTQIINPCTFCENGVTNPALVVPEGGDQTCAEVKLIAAQFTSDDALCATVKEEESACCPPEISVTLPTLPISTTAIAATTPVATTTPVSDITSTSVATESPTAAATLASLSPTSKPVTSQPTLPPTDEIITTSSPTTPPTLPPPTGTGIIAGVAFYDSNNNGNRESLQEYGVWNIKPSLYSCGDDTTSLAKTSTSTQGMYQFENLAEGSYYIKFEYPIYYLLGNVWNGDPSTPNVGNSANPENGMTNCFTLNDGAQFEADVAFVFNPNPNPPPATTPAPTAAATTPPPTLAVTTLPPTELSTVAATPPPTIATNQTSTVAATAPPTIATNQTSTVAATAPPTAADVTVTSSPTTQSVSNTCVFCEGGIPDLMLTVPTGQTCGAVKEISADNVNGSAICNIIQIEETVCCPKLIANPCTFCEDGIPDEDSMPESAGGATCGEVKALTIKESADSVICSILQQPESSCCPPPPPPPDNPCLFCEGGMPDPGFSFVVDGTEKTCAELKSLVGKEGKETDLCATIQDVEYLCCRQTPPTPDTNPPPTIGPTSIEPTSNPTSTTYLPTSELFDTPTSSQPTPAYMSKICTFCKDGMIDASLEIPGTQGRTCGSEKDRAESLNGLTPLCRSVQQAQDVCCPEPITNPCTFCEEGIDNLDLELPQSGGRTCGTVNTLAATMEQGSELCTTLKQAEILCCPLPAKFCTFCPEGIPDPTIVMSGGQSCGSMQASGASIPSNSDLCSEFQAVESQCCPVSVSVPPTKSPSAATKPPTDDVGSPISPLPSDSDLVGPVTRSGIEMLLVGVENAGQVTVWQDYTKAFIEDFFKKNPGIVYDVNANITFISQTATAGVESIAPRGPIRRQLQKTSAPSVKIIYVQTTTYKSKYPDSYAYDEDYIAEKPFKEDPEGYIAMLKRLSSYYDPVTEVTVTVPSPTPPPSPPLPASVKSPEASDNTSDNNTKSIIIGVVCGVILVAVIAGLLIVRKRKMSRNRDSAPQTITRQFESDEDLENRDMSDAFESKGALAAAAALSNLTNCEVISSGEGMFHVIAPEGKLGVVVATSPQGGPVYVADLREDSPLLGKVHLGDKIIAIDDDDAQQLSSTEVSKLIARKSRNPQRKFTILREEAPSSDEANDAVVAAPANSSSEDFIHVVAPEGKLGVVVATSPQGGPAYVVDLREDSPLLGKVHLGDKIIAIDDDDVQQLSSTEVSKLLARKSRNPQRKLTILREEDQEEAPSSDEANDALVSESAFVDSNSEHTVTIIAPKGKLGVVVQNRGGGSPFVSDIREGSVLEGQIQLNDRILSVDDQDVRELKAFHISKILASKNQNSARKIVVSRGTIV